MVFISESQLGPLGTHEPNVDSSTSLVSPSSACVCFCRFEGGGIGEPSVADAALSRAFDFDRFCLVEDAASG